jgi:hypothetical protein
MGFSLREKIEWEFESVQDSLERSNPDKDDRSGGNERCSERDADLSSYPAPSYCPECGAKL